MQEMLKARLRDATEASSSHNMTLVQGNLYGQNSQSTSEKERIMDSIRGKLTETFGDKLLKDKNNIEFQVQLREGVRRLVDMEKIEDSTLKRESLVDQIMTDVLGYGPIQRLLEDETITEIEIARYDKVFIEIDGKMVLQPEIRFDSERHLVSVIERIISPLGRKITSMHPMVNARLPDGSRVHATLQDLTPDGATLTIRKFPMYRLTADDYLKWGALNTEMLDFLKAVIEAQLNVIVSGGTGTGKTTLLNMLSNYLPSHLAIITIEDTLELKLQQDNVRRMEAKEGVDGKGVVTIRDCVKETLRMRPNSIVVGEIRSGEIVDMFRAITSGHSGLSTVHADSPRDLVDTVIPILFGMSDMSFTEMAQKKLIASAVPIIVQIERFEDGSRKISHITHVCGVGKEGAKELGIEKAEPNQIYLQDIFRYVQTGVANGKVQGHFEATGYKPAKVIQRLVSKGVRINESVFEKRSVPKVA